MFKLTVRQYVAMDNKVEDDTGASFCRSIYLPFAPRSGDVIGFEPDSDFECEETLLERVMWLARSNEFIAEAPTSLSHDRRVWEHTVEFLVKTGWTIYLNPDFDTPKGAVNSLGESGIWNGKAVKVGGKWYGADATELRAMELAGIVAEETVGFETYPEGSSS